MSAAENAAKADLAVSRVRHAMRYGSAGGRVRWGCRQSQRLSRRRVWTSLNPKHRYNSATGLPVDSSKADRSANRVLITSREADQLFSPLSRLLVGCWIRLYGLDSLLLGGCRPLRLGPWLEGAGFEVKTDDVMVMLAVPSQVVAVTLK